MLFRVVLGFAHGCFRHAADTAPLEGLQISKMRLAQMGV